MTHLSPALTHAACSQPVGITARHSLRMRRETSLPQNSFWQLLWRFTKLTAGVGVFVFVIAQYAYGISLRNPWQNTQPVNAKATSAYVSWQVFNETNDARAVATNVSGAAATDVSSTIATNAYTVASNVSTFATNVSTVAPNVSSTVTTNVSHVIATNVYSRVVANVPGVLATNSYSTVGHNVLSSSGSSGKRIAACPLIPANLSKYP